MDEWPYPAGTYVMARHRDGIPLRRSCVNHIWRIETDPKPVDYACGFIQTASCVVCGDGLVPHLDADFFMEKATPAHVAHCLQEVAGLVEHYHRVKDLLEHWGSGQRLLRNFD